MIPPNPAGSPARAASTSEWSNCDCDRGVPQGCNVVFKSAPRLCMVQIVLTRLWTRHLCVVCIASVMCAVCVVRVCGVLCVGLRVLLFLLGRPPGELLRCASYARSSSPVLSHNRLLGRHQHQELSRMNLTKNILNHLHLGLQVPCGASSVRAPEQLLAF